MVLTIFLLIAVHSDVSNLRSTNHLSIWTLVPNWWCNCRIKIKENLKIDGVWEPNHLNRPRMQTWTCEWKIHCLEVLEENVKTWNFSLIQKVLQRVDEVSIAYEKLIPENFCIKTNSPIKFLAFFNHEHMLRDKISSLSCRSNCDLQTEEHG